MAFAKSAPVLGACAALVLLGGCTFDDLPWNQSAQPTTGAEAQTQTQPAPAPESETTVKTADARGKPKASKPPERQQEDMETAGSFWNPFAKEETPEPTKFEDRYCYRTLGEVDCYTHVQPDRARQRVGYFHAIVE